MSGQTKGKVVAFPQQEGHEPAEGRDRGEVGKGSEVVPIGQRRKVERDPVPDFPFRLGIGYDKEGDLRLTVRLPEKVAERITTVLIKDDESLDHVVRDT